MSGEQQVIACSLLAAHNSPLTPQRRRNSLPIWSCSVWGLPCPRHYWWRCALTAPFHPYPAAVVNGCVGRSLLPASAHKSVRARPLTTAAGRYVFCDTFRRVTLTSSSRTLSGTLLCGVRTFLPRHLMRRERPSGPAAYSLIIVEYVPDRSTSSAGDMKVRVPGRSSNLYEAASPLL